MSLPPGQTSVAEAKGVADAPPPPPPPPREAGVTPAAPTTMQNGGTPSPPPPAQNGGSPALSPMQSRGSTAALVAGVVVGVVVFLAVVSALVFFWFRRQRKAKNEVDGANETPAAGDGALPPQAASSFHLLESQPAKESSAMDIGESQGVSRDHFKLSPLQSPKAQSSQEVLQISGSQLHSASTSSSLSTGDNAQPPLVSVGVKAFGYEELSQATNWFSEDSFLGRGGFGSVYKGVLSNSDDVAIKVLQTGSFQGHREFVTEINVISRVHHRNLVSLVGYCISGPERLLVYEYVENNNLSFHLLGSETPALDWATRMSIALGAAKGIAYLHEECHPRIIHRDIKSTNILLDSNFKAKVADFGLAKFVPDYQTHVTTRVIGTFGYLAPEFGSSGRLTEKSDVFSFGVVLLELITGRQPINLVEWVSPLLDQALEDGKFTSELIDPKLADSYDYEEMKRIVTCAAISVHRFPNHRPRMSQVVQVLEGNISPEKLMAETTRPRIRQTS